LITSGTLADDTQDQDHGENKRNMHGGKGTSLGGKYIDSLTGTTSSQKGCKNSGKKWRLKQGVIKKKARTVRQDFQGGGLVEEGS